MTDAAAPGAPKCPVCSTSLPHVVSVHGAPERMLELTCPTCAFVLAFVGPGVHVPAKAVD